MVEGNLGGSSISKLKTLEKLQLHHLPAQDREQCHLITAHVCKNGRWLSSSRYVGLCLLMMFFKNRSPTPQAERNSVGESKWPSDRSLPPKSWISLP